LFRDYYFCFNFSSNHFLISASSYAWDTNDVSPRCKSSGQVIGDIDDANGDEQARELPTRVNKKLRGIKSINIHLVITDLL
jgi:hypothetical protein